MSQFKVSSLSSSRHRRRRLFGLRAEAEENAFFSSRRYPVRRLFVMQPSASAENPKRLVIATRIGLGLKNAIQGSRVWLIVVDGFLPSNQHQAERSFVSSREKAHIRRALHLISFLASHLITNYKHIRAAISNPLPGSHPHLREHFELALCLPTSSSLTRLCG
jgi:hypothetical protein